MAIVPITKELFRHKRFKRPETYHFASQDSIAPLALSEVINAMRHVPIGFFKVNDGYMPVLLQGLSADKNLFVLPSGRWIGRYVPVCYRLQPFLLGSAQQNQHVLCCDDASDLISEIEGEPFYDEESNPSAVVTEILRFLDRHTQNLRVTRELCSLLDAQGLLTEWPIKWQDQDGVGQPTLAGLYRVNEQALNNLDAQTLSLVHQAGALPLIYGQLLSMQNLTLLGALSKEYQAASKRAVTPTPADTATPSTVEESGMTFLADDTTITFERL